MINNNQLSPYCDFVYYESSVTPGLKLAARILKPAQPSYILVETHGWHMSIPAYTMMNEPDPSNSYLRIQVDMRGRAHSTGEPDCNGLELFDVIDAVQYARTYYRDYIIDPEVVYFEAESGGGGNGLALIGKFPDFFSAATCLCGISDYAAWYDNDEIGEFRDEMDVWIGCSPEDNPMAYEARSGISILPNLITPLFIAHGETDERVPVTHSREYIARAKEIGKDKQIDYFELKGIGTRDHWGNITPTQLETMMRKSEHHRQTNRIPPQLPRTGQLIVAGYVVTKHFSIHLDSIDKTAIATYDLDQKKFHLTCPKSCEYRIELY